MATMAKEIDTGAVLIERAQALVPTLAARAEETARLRRMPDETFRDLRDLDLLKAARAERFGGYALGLDEVLEIVVRLGRRLRILRLGLRKSIAITRSPSACSSRRPRTRSGARARKR